MIREQWLKKNKKMKHYYPELLPKRVNNIFEKQNI